VVITYLYQYFNTPAMVGGTRSYEMARRLVAKGHEVHMITSSRSTDGGRDWTVTEEDGIQVHWLPIPYSNSLSYSDRIKAFLRFAACAGPRAAQIDSDVILASSTPLTIALPGIWASWRRKVPMVFEVRDLWPELPIALGALKTPISRSAARALERLAYAKSAHVIALSPGMAEGVHRGGVPLSRIHLVPNSADLDLFDPANDRSVEFRTAHPSIGSAPFLLYAGTLGRINGVDYLVDLATEFAASGSPVKVVVQGRGSEEPSVCRKAQQAGVLGSHFFLLPPASKNEVVPAFHAASGILSTFIDLPEMEANSANKFFDGLAAGRPVVINYGGWQADLIEESGCGMVISRDTRLAAQELQAWFDEPCRLKQAGIQARKLAEDRFARDMLAEKMEAVLLKAAAERVRP